MKEDWGRGGKKAPLLQSLLVFSPRSSLAAFPFDYFAQLIINQLRSQLIIVRLKQFQENNMSTL